MIERTEGGGDPHHQAASTTNASTSTPQRKRQSHPNASEAARLYRRGRALLDCGHRADPYTGCRRCDPVSPRQAEAAITAVEHLDEHGLPALVDAATCRAIWRAGHRRLAGELHRRTTGAA